MKVVLLAGGLGTRISEESQFKPKPMIDICGMPILWHIMKGYSNQGFNEFVICAGYKQAYIKKWFSDYFINTSDVTFDFSRDDEVIVHNKHSEPWKVTVVDTGLDTMTGGRIKRISEYVGNEPFLLTYGDGVADVNVNKVLEFHHQQAKLATITVVQPESRFGYVDIDGDIVKSFREKSKADIGWINAGFMVLEPQVFNYIDGDNTVFEREPMEKLAADCQMVCYKHKGFWQCMDTLRDKQRLEDLWESGNAPWKLWE